MMQRAHADNQWSTARTPAAFGATKETSGDGRPLTRGPDNDATPFYKRASPSLMRFVLGLLSGVLGMLAGWSALAALVVALSGPDRDGGLAMGAFFNIGPFGGVAGLIAGIWLFNRIGIVREGSASAPAETSGTASPPRRQLSYPFAVTILLLAAGIAYWAWYELIRSPYLSHGFMTLELQFRLPSGMGLPSDKQGVQIEVEERGGYATVNLSERWRGHDGDRQVILATAELSYKTRHRVVWLTLPGTTTDSWRLDLSGDPDPTPGYTPWRASDNASGTKIEMNYRLSADR